MKIIHYQRFECIAFFIFSIKGIRQLIYPICSGSEISLKLIMCSSIITSDIQYLFGRKQRKEALLIVGNLSAY